MSLAGFASLLLLSSPCPAGETPAWKLDGFPVQWQVEGEVEEDKDVSGIVITKDGHGALVSDETRGFQTFTFCREKKVVKMGGSQTLLPGKGTEVDFESAALSPCGGYAYFAGSHSMARKKGVIEPTRANVFRVGVTPAGGFSNRSDQADFRAAIATQPQLAAALDQPADGSGVDIEGLAVRGENLLLGFRAPVIDGKAAVLEVPEAAVFGRRPGKPETTLHLLDLGQGRGIRDMLRVPDGFLLIGGAAGADPSSATFDLFFWPGPGQAAALIGEIPSPPGKAEALGLLEATPDSLEILILFDGAADGAPRAHRLRKE